MTSSEVPAGSRQKQQESLTKEEEEELQLKGTCGTQGALQEIKPELAKTARGRIQSQPEAQRQCSR